MLSGVAKILPVINVQGKDAHPWTGIVSLGPNAFVGQFAPIRPDPVEVVLKAVDLDGFNKVPMLRPQRLNHNSAIDSLRLRKWCDERPSDTGGRLSIQRSMEACDPSPDRALHIEIGDCATSSILRDREFKAIMLWTSGHLA